MGDVKWSADLVVGPVGLFLTLARSRTWVKLGLGLRVRRALLRADFSLWLFRSGGGQE